VHHITGRLLKVKEMRHVEIFGPAESKR
jgi:hypothetical protein